MIPVVQSVFGATPAAVPRSASLLLRALVVGIMAFLTVVDLFATQAILPALTRAYGTTPAVMGFAVNASTIGMATAGLSMALIGRRIERRSGILVSLTLLAIPTLLLAGMPNIAVFTGLRIIQGLLMASAFTLTLAHLGETSTPREAASAFAAYITGNVASNLFGRLISAAVADHFGLASNFLAFAALNLAGALLVCFAVPRAKARSKHAAIAGSFTALLANLRDPALRAAFAVGFCILFAFIGTFTFINFVLVRRPFALGMMSIGFVYFVFLPSIITTPFAGGFARRWGSRASSTGGLSLAMLGLPLLLVHSLPAVLFGMVLVSVGTFFAQAVATGFVGRAARADRAAASGMYLASYFSGGLAGSVLLGQLFDRIGWPVCVAGIGCALLAAIALSRRMVAPSQT
jgi:predicted MFS family arabinose efflux permease